MTEISELVRQIETLVSKWVEDPLCETLGEIIDAIPELDDPEDQIQHDIKLPDGSYVDVIVEVKHIPIHP